MASYLPTPLTREILAYVLSPEEAFVYARLLPDDTFLQKLSAGITLQQCAMHIAGIGWVEGLSQLANESKYINIDSILKSAASGGHIDTMELAKSWGANGFNAALCVAADGSHIAAMELARTWGATNLNEAFYCAASSGSIAAMELAKTWGVTEFNYALMYASAGGQITAMELLKAWGANCFNGALSNAASGGHQNSIATLRG